jgi:hypothetical protein
MSVSVGSATSDRLPSPRRSPGLGLALCVALALASGCTGSTATPSPLPSPTAATPTATAGQTLIPGPVKPGWNTTGAMAVARQSTHALLLGDGRVLVVGDDRWDDQRYRSYLRAADTSVVAELWDPGANTWRTAEPLPKPRAGFAAVVLRDGRALVAGGANPDCASYSSAYLFDPASEQWSKTGLMRTARTQPAIAVLPDGRVLVAGGYFSRSCQDWADMYGYDRPAGSSDVVLAAYRSPGDDRESRRPGLDDVDPGPLGRGLATAELFDPATGTWSDTGSMRMIRSGASAVTLADGRVLVWGGTGEYGDTGASDRAEIYDPATGRFSWTEPLPAPDRSMFDELGLKVPSDPFESWINGGRLLRLSDGGALLVGIEQWWGSYDVTRSFRFRSTEKTWTGVGGPLVTDWDADTPKTYGTRALDGILAPLPDGRVLVARDDSTVELFDPTSGAWSTAPSMPGDRDTGVTVTLADGSVLLVPVGQGYSTAFLFVAGS